MAKKYSFVMTEIGNEDQAPLVKTKATFYLDKLAFDMLQQMFIESLKNNKKMDKSFIVCKAIKVLYEREL